MHSTHLLPLATLASLALGHGYVKTPAMRMPGDLTRAACGRSVVDSIVGDPTSHVEGLPELAAADSEYDAAACNLWLCRGVLLESATAVPAYAPGQTVDISAVITIPHAGPANVSIVDTAANEIIGEQLLVWPTGYADERQFYNHSLPLNQTEFSITIPTDLGDKCATAGDCVSCSVFLSCYNTVCCIAFTDGKPSPYIGHSVVVVWYRR